MRGYRGVGVALLLAAIVGALHGSFFPIGPAGFATRGDSSYLPQVESLGGNWAWVDCVQLSMSANLIEAALDTAYAHGFRILLSDAGIDSTNPGLNLANIAGGKFHNYESDSLCAPGDVGVRERDTLALDDWAWVVDSSSDTAGAFQTDTTLDYLGGIWDLNWGNPLPYDAYFRLRADTAGMGQTDKVCSLAVTTLTTDTLLPHVESLVVCSTLVASDFPDSTTYVEFRLQFEKRIQHSMVPFRYKIYWFRNARKLWSDCVRTYDKYAFGLLRDTLPGEQKTRYRAEVESIVDVYNLKPAVYRYYLADEPFSDQMKCCGIVNDLLGRKGINWCNSRFSEYVNSVAPAQLYVDCYKLMGRTYPSQGPNPPPGGSERTPVDCGSTFQQQLDAECQELGAAREAANDTIPIWCTVQAFGEYLSTDNTLQYKSEWNTLSGPGVEPRSDEGISREPTAREFRCMSWLALACGAKGLDCMQLVPMAGHWYSTDGTKHYWLIGLMGYDPAEKVPRGHRALFDTVRALNSALAKIAPTLLNLHCDAVSQWSGTPIGFVQNLTLEPEQDSTWWNNRPHIGTFHDETHQSDKYFIIVNRRCQPSDTISPTVTIEGLQAVKLCDQVTGETLYGSPNQTFTGMEFSVRLSPGGGRLFSLIPGQQWCRLTDLPLGLRNKSVKDGGALAFAESDTGFVYAFKGNNTCEFYRYNTAKNTWLTRESIPLRNGNLKNKAVKKGSSLVVAGNDKLYAAKGNNCYDWWQYDPVGNTWAQKADVPAGGVPGTQYRIAGRRREFNNEVQHLEQRQRRNCPAICDGRKAVASNEYVAAKGRGKAHLYVTRQDV